MALRPVGALRVVLVRVALVRVVVVLGGHGDRRGPAQVVTLTRLDRGPRVLEEGLGGGGQLGGAAGPVVGGDLARRERALLLRQVNATTSEQEGLSEAFGVPFGSEGPRCHDADADEDEQRNPLDDPEHQV